MSDDPFRDGLSTRAELDAEPRVVCPRCGIIHTGMSREDYDAIIARHASEIAAAVDAEIARLVYGDAPAAPQPPRPKPRWYGVDPNGS